LIKDNKTIFRTKYPFLINIDGFIYNISGKNTKNFYIPKTYVQEILAIIYDKKYYFGKDRILYDLRRLTINKKTYLVKKYVEYYPTYQLN
ncbi:hypothetical protein QBC45DRAFT_320870, partial [Copromyces sp. CBS 386.78]